MSKKRKRKKKVRKKVTEPGYELKSDIRESYSLPTGHHATRALATYLACMDLINLTVQYRYATITQRYRVQRVKGIGSQ